MSAEGSARAPVTFHDVAVYFSEDEWEFLEEWQKELYKNVMREIHGVLISMGYAIVNPDTLFRVKKEENLFVSNDPACKKRESSQGHASGSSSVLCPDILLRIKQEEEPVLYHPPVFKKRERILNSAPQHPAETSIISVRIKEEEDPYPLDPPHLERTESFNSPTTNVPIVTSVFSLNNKPEDATYSRGHQDLGKGFLDIPPEVVSMDRKNRNPQEGFNDVKLHMEVPERATDESPYNFGKKNNWQREQKLRGHLGILPRYIPEFHSMEWEKASSNHAGPVVQQATHGREQPYTYTELPNEKFTHQGKRPYQCNECEKGFWKLYCYKVHQRIHTGEKPYTCHECGKSFSQSSHLIRHRRIHTRETPYTCKECGKSYSNKSNCDKHKKTHTNL